MDIGDPIKTTVEEIRKVLNIENVIGEVIETDDKTLIPITKMGMGFGAGMAEGKQESNGGSGSGAAGAAGIEPIAMIVVFKNVEGPEGVKVLTLSSNPVAQAMGELGSAAMETVKGLTQKHKKEEKKEEEEPKE
ncbi:MAG: GerW family sporulation protein [Methanothermobacter sp.]